MALDNARHRRQLRVKRARGAHVVERERQVVEISRLAVAIPEPREDPEHLEMPLHADEIEPAQKLAGAAAAGPAALQQLGAIAAHPLLHARAWPGDVAILQQRNEVVADGARERILKIDD